MKKVIFLLALVMSLTTLTFAGSMDHKITSATISADIQANGMELQDLLAAVHEQTGVKIYPVPDIAKLKVELNLKSDQTVQEILTILKEKYGLYSKINAAQTAIILFPGHDYAENRMFNATSVQLAMSKQIRQMSPSLAMPGIVRPPEWNTEEYKTIRDNRFHDVRTTPLSTFSIDVDTASYSNVRRFLNAGNMPPADAVRTEELLNYFTYDYPQPDGDQLFSVTTDVGASPWNSERKLVLIGIQGKNLLADKLPPSNLVFLIDVSGSMYAKNKLPLLKTAFKMLVQQLRNQDRVSIVVYAGAAGVVLDSTSGAEKAAITAKIDSLQAGGSTAGGEGIKLAYQIAKEHFIEGGNNRVILATDGDFNVGVSSEGELKKLIESRRNEGIFLTVLGFGMGNIKDNKMETLADYGNGNYAYIDNALEAKKVMISQLAGTLYTIAKDMKIQVEFNPAYVQAYRLIGYENRVLAERDFNDDQRDAGEMGAGQSVTALYEIIPTASSEVFSPVDPLVYQQVKTVPSNDLMQIKIRYKKPLDDVSNLVTTHVDGKAMQNSSPSENLRFASAVAEYGMLLRKSEFQSSSSYRQALSLARGARGSDENGYRAEFIKLLELSQLLDTTE